MRDPSVERPDRPRISLTSKSLIAGWRNGPREAQRAWFTTPCGELSWLAGPRPGPAAAKRGVFRNQKDRRGLLALAADLLELGEHGLHVELLVRLLDVLGLLVHRLGGGHLGRKQRDPMIGLRRLFLGGAMNLEVEVDLRAQPEGHRIERREAGRVPVAAVADRLGTRLGRSHQPA